MLSRVLEHTPDLDRVPSKFRKLLSRCLDRNAKHRLRDIGETRFLLSPLAAQLGARSSLIFKTSIRTGGSRYQEKGLASEITTRFRGTSVYGHPYQFRTRAKSLCLLAEEVSELVEKARRVTEPVTCRSSAGDRHRSGLSMRRGQF